MSNVPAFSERFYGCTYISCLLQQIHCVESKYERYWEIHLKKIKLHQQISKFQNFLITLFTHTGSLKYNSGLSHWPSTNNGFGAQNTWVRFNLTIARNCNSVQHIYLNCHLNIYKCLKIVFACLKTLVSNQKCITQTFFSVKAIFFLQRLLCGPEKHWRWH